MNSLANALIGGALLAASTVVSAAAPSTPAPEPEKERKICRTERATGSLTRRTRICLTAEEWRELNSRTKKGLDEMGRNASGGTAVQNNPGAGG